MSGPAWEVEAQAGLNSGIRLFCVLQLKGQCKKNLRKKISVGETPNQVNHLAEYLIHRGRAKKENQSPRPGRP